MTKKRIQVYADEETKRSIELAAAKHDIPVTEYCLEAIKLLLAEDDLLGRNTVKIAIKPPREDDLITRLRALHTKILKRRDGELIDIDRHLDKMREERDYEITGLR